MGAAWTGLCQRSFAAIDRPVCQTVRPSAVSAALSLRVPSPCIDPVLMMRMLLVGYCPVRPARSLQGGEVREESRS